MRPYLTPDPLDIELEDMEWGDRLEAKTPGWLEHWILPTLMWFLHLRSRWKAREFLRQEPRRCRIREGTIKATIREYERSEKWGRTHFQDFYRVGLFVAMVDFDFATIYYGYIRETQEWRRRFYLRQLVLLLYEVSKDMPEVLGQLRRTLKHLPTQDGDLDELGAISTEYNRIWREVRPELQDIRSAVAAHRDHNAYLQIQTIRALDPIKITNRASEFVEAGHQLIPFLTRVMNGLVDPKTLIDHTTKVPDL